jgi:hypothetical protein
MNISITIERLIFDGISIPHHHRAQVQSACEAELTHLLAANGVSFALQVGGTQRRIQGGVLEVWLDEAPQVWGKKLAQAIYKGIGQ